MSRAMMSTLPPGGNGAIMPDRLAGIALGTGRMRHKHGDGAHSCFKHRSPPHGPPSYWIPVARMKQLLFRQLKTRLQWTYSRQPNTPIKDGRYETQASCSRHCLRVRRPGHGGMPEGLQIYGRVNVTAERITVDDSSNTVVQPNMSNYELVDNSSRIGFRYKKELVPGNSIVPDREPRQSDRRRHVLSSRDSYAGFAGDSWGSPPRSHHRWGVTRRTTTSACTTTTPARLRMRCSPAQWSATRDSWTTPSGTRARSLAVSPSTSPSRCWGNARRSEHGTAAPHRPGRLV